MKKLIEYPLKDGGTVLIEIDEPERAAAATGIRGLRDVPSHGMVERAEQTFDEALEKVKPAASVLITKLRELRVPPEEIGVEFGVKFSAKTGACIASSDADANFKIKLTWKRTA